MGGMSFFLAGGCFFGVCKPRQKFSLSPSSSFDFDETALGMGVKYLFVVSSFVANSSFASPVFETLKGNSTVKQV